MFTKNMRWVLIRKLSNLRFSIGMLLSIALIILVGTIIEQDQSLAYYKLNYPEDKSIFFRLTWKQITGLGLDHIYNNYVFLIILVLFFLTLITCTFSTQLPILNQARRWKFFYNDLQARKMPYTSKSFPVSFINFIYVLNLNKYYVFHKNKAIYAYKGLLGRIAPIFVHISIVFTLIGAMISLSFGFLAQETIPIGEVFHVQNIIKSGYLSHFSDDFVGKVNDFYIDHDQNNSIKQFFSDISIVDNRTNSLFRDRVSVNHPLYFQGMVLYQTNWQLGALRIGLGKDFVFEKSLQEISIKARESLSWGCQLKISQQYQLSILIDSLNNRILVYDTNGDLLKDTTYGLWNIFYGVPLVFKDLMPITGLQVKVDPGVYVSYMSFFILIVSILISYTSYSQVWANSIIYKFCFSGKTNRAFVAFEDEMMKLNRQYYFLLKNIL